MPVVISTHLQLVARRVRVVGRDGGVVVEQAVADALAEDVQHGLLNLAVANHLKLGLVPANKRDNDDQR